MQFLQNLAVLRIELKTLPLEHSSLELEMERREAVYLRVSGRGKRDSGRRGAAAHPWRRTPGRRSRRGAPPGSWRG